jgi:hypothetical protein
MTYHIKQIDNQSDRSVALTNPKTGTSKRDCVLILPAPAQKQPYVPEHPPEVNKIEGNPNYTKAAVTALNIYTKADNFCFWDNTDSAVNWLGENSSTTQSYNATGGDLKLIISPSGTISFLRL